MAFERRAKLGFVETPREIACLLVELASVGEDAFVLDTGCGRGVFLQVLKERGCKNIYGIEVDEELFRHCREHFENVILGDFLSDEFEQPFDLIVGNPPYVHFSKLPKHLAEKVKEITKTGEADIYYAFILRAISLLKDGGELIYIVPYHFFYNTHAKYLRENLLASGKIEIIIDLGEVCLFHGESPETVIFKFKKGQFDLEKEKITVLQLKHTRAKPLEIYTKAKLALETKTSNDLFSYYEIPHFLNSQSWSVHVFTPSFSFSLRLKYLAKVGVGLISGLERAFYVSEEELEGFGNNEKALVKKFVKAKNCKRFVVFADQKLAQQKGCNACHAMEVKKVGPSYADIAKKYADKPDAVDYLAGKIKKGGSGVWGSVPMPPQNVSEVEAKQLAKWILDLK